MKLQQLRCFVAVVEEGSFTRAAERINLTQPALSRHVRRLEERLGVQLFVRGRRTKPTADGLRFLPEARSILEGTVRLREEAHDNRHTVPAVSHRLIGRSEALRSVLTTISGPSRICTLIGAPGVGKTRLALEVARQTQRSFPEGVWWVELASLRDATQVLNAVAMASGAQQDPTQTVLEVLAGHWAQKQILLVLDNFEHVLGAAADLAALLKACPRMQLLVTSREPLCLQEEITLLVEPLSYPTGDDSDPQRDAEAPAVALFVERARLMKPGFALDQSNYPKVLRLCARLDGLPLALELVAARANLLSVGQMLERLEQHQAIPTPPGRMHPRHASLNAAIGWSYELLSADEQRLLRYLAVFAGGCSLEALVAIAREVPDVINGLAHLVDHHLAVTGNGPNGEPRFRALETIREYAFERLTANGEQWQAQSRMEDYYLAMTEGGIAELLGAEKRVWLGRFAQEHANLCQILLAATSSEQVRRGLRLATLLHSYWHMNGRAKEGMRWLETLLAAAPADVAGRAEAERTAGVLAFTLGDMPSAEAHLRCSVDLHRKAGGGRELAPALTSLGSVMRAQGCLEEARDLSL